MGELQAASDNFERATDDASAKLDAASAKALDDARAVANRLKASAEVTDAEFDALRARARQGPPGEYTGAPSHRVRHVIPR